MAGLPAGKVENLLTVCRFFDRELAGYLADEDLEEIGYMVSDSMSSERGMEPVALSIPLPLCLLLSANPFFCSTNPGMIVLGCSLRAPFTCPRVCIGGAMEDGHAA